MDPDRIRIVVGCMTGTSLDGLDVALVRIVGNGLSMRPELLGHHALPLTDELRAALTSLASGGANEPIDYLRTARALGELHADGIERLLAGGLAPPIDVKDIDFVAAHGQTIWHAPGDEPGQFGGGPKSWQLFDPWPIIKRFNKPVCYDLRQADLIAGGEGAPLTPIADWVMYREHADVVANLGGVLNTTTLAADLSHVRGGDLYPCNLLLDGLCQRYFQQPYDEGGGHAKRGRLTPQLVDALHAAIHEACEDRESLGREQFSRAWLDRLVQTIGGEQTPENVIHTAARLIATQLGGEYREPGLPPRRLVLAGGGAKNEALVDLIRDQSFYNVSRSDDLGIPCEAREAMGFAVLGALSQDGIPISLPQVTGAAEPGVAGAWAGL